MISYRITNQEKFDAKVEKVNISKLHYNEFTHLFVGSVYIELKEVPEHISDEEKLYWTQGEHYANEFEEEFGFIIENA